MGCIGSVTKRLPTILTITLFLMVGYFPSASGFSEDVCYYQKGDKILPKAFNCWDLQCKDGIGSKQGRCVVSGAMNYLNATNLVGTDLKMPELQVRNSLHYDAVWLISRLHGMSKTDAAQVAVFSQATDPGEYQHYDAWGNKLEGNTSGPVHGLSRTDFFTAGFWLHYPARMESKDDTGATIPLSYHHNPKLKSPFDTEEVAVNNLRRWAFGQRSMVCEFGLSSDPGNPDAPCYTAEKNVGINVFFPMFRKESDMDLNAVYTLDWQKILEKEGDQCHYENLSLDNMEEVEATLEKCYEKDFAPANRGAPAALGIYLHSMIDRLSHFYCADLARIKKVEGKAYQYDLTFSPDCSVVAHALMHYTETGGLHLPKRTKDALDFMYWETEAWLKVFPERVEDSIKPRKGYPQVKDSKKVVGLIMEALEKEKAQDRVASLCKIAVDGYGLIWHDGSTNCVYPGSLRKSASVK